MRICYVFMTFPAPSETFAAVELRAIRARGADLTVHALRPAHPRAAAMLRERDLEDIPLSHGSSAKFLQGMWTGLVRSRDLAELLAWITRHTWRKPREWMKSLVLIPLIFNLFRQIEEAGPDVVHLFWGHYPAMLGHLLSRHCPDVVLSMFLGAYDLTQGYACSVDTACRADVVWTHARCNIGELERRGIPAAKIRLSYRGVDQKGIAAEVRPKIPLRIVSAGRLLNSKRMDKVLAVFAKVHGQVPGATLVIIGEGPEEMALRRQARDLGVDTAVTFTGHIPHTDVYAEMQKAEIFLFLSESASERLPNVVKEAMASRCLCVVSATPGIDELIQSGENGIVLSGDLSAASDHIVDLFRQSATLDAMAAQGYETVREKFDVSRNAETYLVVWETLLKTRKFRKS